ncbi:MAG: hypothetical protein IIC21_01735 [Chloroflexi bacterium]|nr:hypothetical protein [Chloroflexota bacterium]
MPSAISNLVSAWPLVIKRSIAQWRLLSTVIIGVLLATTIMSGTVIYFEALRELALKNTLEGLTVQDKDILIKAERGPTNFEEYQKVRQAMTRQFDGRLGWLLRDTIRGGKTATFFLTVPGNEEAAGEDNSRSYFVFSPRLPEYIEILPGGRFPNERALDNPNVPFELEALVSVEAAEAFGVGVGDRLSVVPYWTDRLDYAGVVISGLFRRKDADAEYWYLDDTLFKASTSGSFRTVPFYISELTFMEELGAAFRDMDSSYSFLLAVDPDRINADNSTFTRGQIATMKARLSSDLFSYRQVTELDDALAEYDQRLFFSKIPMFVILVLISVVILYYVVTLSSLLVEQQKGEIALLRSRGASSAQVLAVFVLEGATISLLAIIAAPLIAAATISALGFTPAFSALSDGDRLTVTITGGAYMMSALGGLLSFAALMIPAVQASRVGVARHRQLSARPTADPFFQRFYLDVMLLFVSVFLFRQLSEQGSVVATGLFGDVAVNQILLAVPALILVAFALVLLRLFPLSIRFLSGDSPSLMHLVVVGVTTITAASILFGDAIGGNGLAWLPQLAILGALGALYWYTERAGSRPLRYGGLLVQAGLASAVMMSPMNLPLLEFLTFEAGGTAVQPGIAAGVVLLGLDFPAGGGFIPIPVGIFFLATRAFSLRAPVGYSMGMWQMARNPTHYARLSLLLILMAGLGIFAASFGGTLERSFQEQARYATGSDVRVEGVLLNSRGPTRPLIDSYEELPAVDRVAPALRAFGTDLSKLFGNQYTMFALDSEAMSEVGWFRPDFAEKPMSELLSVLKHEGQPLGTLLPEGSQSIGVRVKADRPHPSVVVSARIKDSNDRYFTYILGRLASGDWTDLEERLERVNRFSRRPPLQPVQPMTLVSLSVHEVNGRGRLRAGSVSFDEVYVRMAGGDVRVLESFQSVSDWNVLRVARESVTDDFQQSSVGFDGENGTGLFIWSEGSPLTGRGIYHGPPVSPLPVIASTSFLADTGHDINDEFEVSVSGHRVPIRIVDSIEFFPTLDTINKTFLLSDLTSVLKYTNLDSTSSELKPNQVWLSTNSIDGERDLLISALENDEPFLHRIVHDTEKELALSQVDPLVQAGWRALLFMAFGAVLILSCLGFLVHAYVSFREREMQFGLMRTIGFSMRQLITLVWVEQALVITAGMALGAEMGRRLGAIIMPFLSHNDRGGQVLPPFVLEINWATLGITYGVMIFVFTAIILGMIWFIRRISLQKILRLGEV